MAYSEAAAQRLRAELGTLPRLTEKRMFGGIAFLIGGNMACGVNGDSLIFRVGAEHYAASLAQPGARVFDFSGQPTTQLCSECLYDREESRSELCDAHAHEHEHDDMLMALVNSPRTGMCGYEGFAEPPY